jgi:ATP-binding cassette subfamily B protein
MIFSEIKRRYPKKFNITVLYTVLNKVFDLAPPFLIGIAVDIVVKKDESLISTLGVTDPWEQLLLVALVTIIVWGLESLFEYFMEVGWRELAQSAQHDIRNEAFSHTLKLDLFQIESRTSGELMSILNDDVNQLERFLNIGAYSLIQLAVTISIIGGAFFYLAPGVAIYGVLPIPLIIFGSLYFKRFLAPKYKDVRNKVGLLNSEFSNSIQGIQTVKAFAGEDFEKEKISKFSDDYRFSNFSAIKISSLFTPLIRMLILCGFLVNLVYGGYLCLNGDIEVGTYSVLIFMIQRLLWPLTSLGTMLDLYQRSKASLERILDLLNTKFEIKSGSDSFNQSNQSIIVDSLNFEYNSREKLFTNLNLEIEHESTVGFVGGTGSGKSTLIKLLLRFYDPNSGSLSIGGVNLKNIDLKELRDNIGYVGQDIYLFHGSIKENISYGIQNLSDDQLVDICKKSQIFEFIKSLPDGFDTIVGERGHRLSGGQRQRLSIARALAKDPKILILDEATSAVDNETEALIQESLRDLKVGRTTIIVAHRLSTIVSADKIFVMSHGSVIQSGTHSELISSDGTYKELWNVQTGL